jgi:hypothetical protein
LAHEREFLTIDLGTRRLSVKLVPQLLTAEQEHCLSVACDLIECAEADRNFFKNIVTLPQIKNT